MALIVETGNQIPGANSFVTDTEYVAYATLKGLTIAVTEELREIDLLAGVDYMLGKECSLQGCRVASTQSMLFPRTGVCLYGGVIASDEIHVNVKNSQMEAAAYSTSGSLLSNTAVGNVKSEKVDVLAVEYFSGGSRSNVNLQRVNVYLQPLMEDTSKLVRT